VTLVTRTSQTNNDVNIRTFPTVANVPARRLRICIVTFELVGLWKNGGIGTLTTGLAELLASAGHAVTVAYTRPEMLTSAEFEAASLRYTQQGITVVPIRHDDLPPITGPLEGFTGWERYGVYSWLIHQSFDIVHASEHLGEVAYCITAKRLGIAFQQTQFWIGCHGSTQWVTEANDAAVTQPFWIWTDATERAVLRDADLVWAPSRYIISWMRRKGFVLPPDRTFFQVYRMPDDLGGIRQTALKTVIKFKEIIFYGRLETRKGLKLFLTAIEVLKDRLANVRVTFMGRVGQIDEHSADSYIAAKLKPLAVDWKIESNFDRQEALKYVTQPGRLVVIASPVDNSPCAVYELLELEACFVACDGGGIAELIDPSCHADVLFDYTLQALVACLERTLSRGEVAPMAAVSRPQAEAAWRAAHLSIWSEIASASTPADPAIQSSIVAAILFDGNASTLSLTIDGLRSSPLVADIVLVASDRRSQLAADTALGVRRLSLDELGHQGIATRLAALKKPVLIVRSGALLSPTAVGRLCEAVAMTDAVVPFVTTLRSDGVEAIELHLAGSLAWSLLYGAASSAAILSSDLMAMIAESENIPGTNILVWLDLAVLKNRKVAALAEALVDAKQVDSDTHYVNDERARLTLFVGERAPDERLLLEAVYGLLVRPPPNEQAAATPAPPHTVPSHASFRAQLISVFSQLWMGESFVSRFSHLLRRIVRPSRSSKRQRKLSSS